MLGDSTCHNGLITVGASDHSNLLSVHGIRFEHAHSILREPCSRWRWEVGDRYLCSGYPGRESVTLADEHHNCRVVPGDESESVSTSSSRSSNVKGGGAGF